ncbi:MAG: protein-methionine-sulfoxide reductase catalytic subunit MsrP [Thermoflexales bacterium]|nr:protein-methionine-sulfoxide reductase catalytic subunit MsrP [Thermoflexales bacterium]
MKLEKIRPSEITPEHVYLSRRRVLRIGALALGTAALSACGLPSPSPEPTQTNPRVPKDLPTDKRDEFGDPANRWEEITNYNNFYEFTMDKQEVARLAQNFKTSPWTVTVGGLVNRPRTYDLDDLRKFGEEERIYRLRCVEGWSMVIPWLGFPLHKLLREVEPLSKARYVRFESLFDPDQMPGQRLSFYPWPYAEGLRLDEAMHDLTLLVTGLYGHPLPPQNGAPVRLAVPWKYGFKSIKSIVRIDLVEEQPATLWNTVAPHEYGFYSNVNPNKPHPRWSQATERRIGEPGRRRTLMFNGYERQVAALYAGMDLMKNY